MKMTLVPHVCGAVFLGVCSLAAADREPVRIVSEVAGSGSDKPHYVCDRAPLAPSGLLKLPIGSITPQGWVRRQLELEATGMIGRLPEIRNGANSRAMRGLMPTVKGIAAGKNFLIGSKDTATW